MSDTNTRIEQFKKMASDDPNNELGHFSLGRAYLDAGNFEGAAASFQRVIEIKPDMSKAYQFLAAAQLQRGQKDQAIATLTKGAEVANGRGDIMPRNEMVKMLKELGAAAPQFEGAGAQIKAGEGQVVCRRCGQVRPKLPGPPFRSAFGQEIYENICPDCWREAIGMGTKVINELRLPLNDPQAQRMWDQHIREFLNLV